MRTPLFLLGGIPQKFVSCLLSRRENIAAYAEISGYGLGIST